MFDICTSVDLYSAQRRDIFAGFHCLLSDGKKNFQGSFHAEEEEEEEEAEETGHSLCETGS